MSLKVIPLHRVALRLETGKLRKHDNLSAAVSEQGLVASAPREEEQSRVLLAAGLWLRVPEQTFSWGFLTIEAHGLSIL